MINKRGGGADTCAIFLFTEDTKQPNIKRSYRNGTVKSVEHIVSR